jgi:hypothetical protein
MKTDTTDWNARREEQRETEWHLRNRVLRLVEKTIDRWEQDEEKYGTLENVCKQIELISKMGRTATEDATDAPQTNGFPDDFLTALEKIQGSEALSAGGAKEAA